MAIPKIDFNAEELNTAENVTNDLPPLESENVERPVQNMDARPVERVIVERERKPKRRIRLLPKIGCSCRSCSCFGCLTIILIIVLFASLLYFKPAFVWNRVKDYLNDGYAPSMYETTTARSVRDEVDTKVGKQDKIEISEKQLQALVRDKLNSDYTRVDIEPNYMRIVQDTEKDKAHPLWLIFEVGQTTDNKLKITKVGFERISAPGFLREAASDSIFQALDTAGVEGENDAVKLVTMFLEADEDGVKVRTVRFDKDKITIEATK